MTTFGRADYNYHTQLKNKHLTSAFGGQYNPADYDQGHWLFQSSGSPNFESERKLVQKELERVVHFAYMAINKYDAIEGLKRICEYYDLNLDTIHLELKS